ncbi:hypothetical protein FNW02_33825 [Komarekiella sp. 'clone 1']|uniref:Uncharacterized protein n=1 Tax=Komarekiella delphini-convector SJRDD-AB1 TaxID=2593771 RepID=A0AA40T4S3_9NOST|nr:hypothetical protein [Komarekiella delphini-convector]MBD6620617.1 hypothetical protein [Komarekiella delphini-convector SJRDD-AB1]
MKRGAIVLAYNQVSDNHPVQKSPVQIFTKILGKWGRKYQHHIYAIGTTMIVSGQAMPAHAFGLFDPTQIALTCMFGGAAAQGNALMNALPAVINAAITVMLFVYFVASGVKVANAIGDGQEITQVIQQPVGVFFVTLVLFIAQQILFADITAACT